MQTLTEMAPAIEIYSIDEAFIDLSGVDSCMSLTDFGSRTEQGAKKYRAHEREQRFENQTMEKLANYAEKRWPGTGGVVDLSDMSRQRKFLEGVSVEDVWGRMAPQQKN